MRKGRRFLVIPGGLNYSRSIITLVLSVLVLPPTFGGACSPQLVH